MEYEKSRFCNLDNPTDLQIMEYKLYSEYVEKEKESGEWIKRESTLVLPHKLFNKLKTNELFTEKAIIWLRHKKLTQLKKNIHGSKNPIT